MKVKELRALLANYPDDAPIFIYNELGECDGLLDRVTYDTPNVEFDMDAANVNADSSVNMKDLVLLQQYLNGWNVELK
jgi:hypothetical protein